MTPATELFRREDHELHVILRNRLKPRDQIAHRRRGKYALRAHAVPRDDQLAADLRVLRSQLTELALRVDTFGKLRLPALGQGHPKLHVTARRAEDCFGVDGILAGALRLEPVDDRGDARHAPEIEIENH